MHELRTSLVLPISLDEAWAFFSVPDNLDDITPPDMGFEILTQNERRTYAGQIIRYRVRPLFNIPMTWVTEITHCEDKAYFVDEQRLGLTPCGTISTISRKWKEAFRWTTSCTTN